MPLGDYRLFIFDWDGTLSTSTLLVRISRLFKRRYNVKYIRRHAGDYRKAGARKVHVREEVNRAYARLYDLYFHFARPRLQPGAIEVLTELKRRKKTIAIFSDSNNYRLMKEIKELGVAEYVDFVLGADTIKRFKPNPQGLLVLVQRYGIKKGRTIYIGDMASDILTARFAGIKIACVGNGVDPYSLLKEVGPDYLYRNLVQLRHALSD
ncbi:MAG: HAD family hydrolase [Candidatus Marsarchaeota archaeon]|jgi:HAD superfamily hydrolase (TIGR01509 family)|nr:HAD family hydrolase [Candidatus Marsarchaeota archaeon]